MATSLIWAIPSWPTNLQTIIEERKVEMTPIVYQNGNYFASWSDMTAAEQKLFPKGKRVFEIHTHSGTFPGVFSVHHRRITVFPQDASEHDSRRALEIILNAMIPVMEKRHECADAVADFFRGITLLNMGTLAEMLSGKSADDICSYANSYTPIDLTEAPAPAEAVGKELHQESNSNSVAQLAYGKFQLQWMKDHGFTIQDLCDAVRDWSCETENQKEYPFSEYLEDQGLGNGSLWPCFDEFVQSEYQDVGLMKYLLSADQYTAYLLDIDDSFCDDVIDAVKSTRLDGDYATWEDFCVEVDVPDALAVPTKVVIWGEETEKGECYFSIYFKNSRTEDTLFSVDAESDDLHDLRTALKRSLIDHIWKF